MSYGTFTATEFEPLDVGVKASVLSSLFAATPLFIFVSALRGVLRDSPRAARLAQRLSQLRPFGRLADTQALGNSGPAMIGH